AAVGSSTARNQAWTSPLPPPHAGEGLMRVNAASSRRGVSPPALLAHFLRMRLQRLGQARRALGAGRHRDARTLELVADRLRAAAQALRQEAFGDRVEGLVVLRAREAVAFVGEQHVG